MSDNGACSGAWFSDAGKSWNGVFAEGSITFDIRDCTAILRYEKKEIKLPSGTVCVESNDCVDRDVGYTFWDLFTPEDCRPDSFHVLYRGRANRAKVYDRNNSDHVVNVYTVKTPEVLLTLTSSGSREYCYLS